MHALGCFAVMCWALIPVSFWDAARDKKRQRGSDRAQWRELTAASKWQLWAQWRKKSGLLWPSSESAYITSLWIRPVHSAENQTTSHPIHRHWPGGRGRVWGSSVQGRRSWVSWWNRTLYSDLFVHALDVKRTATLSPSRGGNLCCCRSSFYHQHDFPGWPKSGDGQRSRCLTSQLKFQQELSLSSLGIIPGLLHKLKELFWPLMSSNKP